MGTKTVRPAKAAKETPHESCEVRERIFTYFKKHGTRGLCDELFRGERTRAYATIRTANKYKIAIYFAKNGNMWTYVFSKDPDGELDRKILLEIDHTPPKGASFEDCSNKKSFSKKSRNVLKLHRPFNWRTLADKEIAALLDDYNWLIAELEGIGAL